MFAEAFSCLLHYKNAAILFDSLPSLPGLVHIDQIMGLNAFFAMYQSRIATGFKETHPVQMSQYTSVSISS